MRESIRKLAWIGVAISVLGFLYQVVTISLLTEDIQRYRMQKAAIDAEVEVKTSWGNLACVGAKSFFDGLTLGIFTDEGIFEEFKRWDRWSTDVINCDAQIIEGHNMALARLGQKIVMRNVVTFIGIVSILVLVFVNKKHPQQLPPPHQVHTSTASASQTINWIPALVLYCVMSAASILLSLVELEDEEAAGKLTLLALPLIILGVVFVSILHYQCWKALPERFRATTPGKAVGYLFIPFYNFYWAFLSWPKLAEGLVEWQKSIGKATLTDARSLAMTYAIIFVCGMTVGWIPGLNILINLGDLVLFIIFYRKIVTAINEMKSANKAMNPTRYRA